MNKLSDKEYSDIHKSISKTISIIEKSENGKVYWYNKKYDSHHIVTREDINISEYMNELEKCDCFIAVISEKVHSSIFFEAGYAIAKSKMCYFFIPSRDVLPSIMDGVADIYSNAKCITYEDLDDFINKFLQLLPKQYATK